MANQTPQNRNNNNNNNRRRLPPVLMLVLALVVALLVSQLFNGMLYGTGKQVTYDVFLDEVEANNIEEVIFRSDRILYTLRGEQENIMGGKTVYCTGLLPDVLLNSVVDALRANDVTFSTKIVQGNFFSTLLSWVIMPILLFGIMMLIMRLVAGRNGGGGFGGSGSIGKSKAKV